MATPSDIILANLTNPPEKGNESPVIWTAEDYRFGYRPASGGGTNTGPALAPDGSLIFDADFNNKPDWVVQHAQQRYNFEGANLKDGASGYVAADNVPDGWDFYYTSDLWHPNGDKDGNGAVTGSSPTGQINNSVGSALDPSGKALIITDESSGGASRWGSDCWFLKELDNEYLELYIEFYLMFQPDFKWESVLTLDEIDTYKIARFGRSSKQYGVSRSQFFGDGPYNQWYLFNLKTQSNVNSWVKSQIWRNKWDYIKPPVTDRIGDSPLAGFSDGNWHKYNIHLAMNSAVGTADGILRVWIDDDLKVDHPDIEWNPLSSDEGIGWNVVSIGGNGDNIPYPEAEQFEQWWAISDFKVWNGIPA